MVVLGGGAVFNERGTPVAGMRTLHFEPGPAEGACI